MLRTFLTATLLAVAVTTAVRAQPAFQDVKFTGGLFGPERAPAVFHRQDEVCLHYTVAGLQTDSDGRIDVTFETKVTDPNGAVALRNSAPAKTDLLLGGDRVPGFFNLALDFPYLPEGEWTVEVAATDNVSRTTATLTQKWEYRPKEFAVVRLGLARDDLFKFPARASTVVVGQPLFFRAKVVNFARERGRLKMDVEVQFLDAEGHEVSKPRSMPIRHQLEGDPSPLECWDLSGGVQPNRAGDFKVRIVAHDRISQKTTQVEVPLHVENP